MLFIHKIQIEVKVFIHGILRPVNTIYIHHLIVGVTTYIEAFICTVKMASTDFICLI